MVDPAVPGFGCSAGAETKGLHFAVATGRGRVFECADLAGQPAGLCFCGVDDVLGLGDLGA